MDSHCCFAGCTPLACGCCANFIGHEWDCPENPSFQLRAWRLSHPPTTPMVHFWPPIEIFGKEVTNAC